MANLATALRSEIRSTVRREVRKALRPLAVIGARLAGLEARAREQRRELVKLRRRLSRVGGSPGVGAKGRASSQRFSHGRPGRPLTPTSIHSMRQRLRLPRREFARLLGVSSASIYGWESGRFTPRGGKLARLAEVRKLGLGEARRQLGLASPQRGRRARARRRRGSA